MSLAVFSEIPLLGHDYGDDQKVAVLAYAGAAEQRAQTQDRGLRVLTLPYKRNTSGRATIDAFFLARGYEKTSFLAKDLNDYARTGISLGTSVASQTVFALPASGPYAGDYPISDANAIVYDDGTPVAIASVNTDARTFTLSSSPTAGSVMTCDYWRYGRYRLDRPYRWRSVAAGVGWYVTEIALREVLS